MTAPPVLAVQDLRIEIAGQPVVDGVTFDIAAGETLAVVGESGCGKSMASLGIIRLLPDVARQTAGQIELEGARIDTLPEHRMNPLRGGRIGMIFQEPVASLDPLMPVGKQIAEALALDGSIASAEIRPRMIEMLERVGIDRPDLRAGQYPFELSGGMCQRIMIAMTMIRRPVLLIADEPTTALDVTIQAQILALMRDLSARTGASVVLITHDLGVVAETCDEVVVMYAGNVVERAPVASLFEAPQHPYTIGLMAAVPRIDSTSDRLETIPGSVPPPYMLIPGCKFASRCPLADGRCTAERPPLREIAPSHFVACWQAPIEEAAQ